MDSQQDNDSQKNTIDSLFGTDTTISNSIITIGSILVGNTAIAPAPLTNEEKPSQSTPLHSFPFVLYAILGGVGIGIAIGAIIATGHMTATIHALISGPTTSSLITLIAITFIVTIIVVGIIHSVRKRHPPRNHPAEHSIHTLRERGIKILGIPFFTSYESETTKERRILFCFFGIPFLRRTPSGYYLVGFIPLTFMVGLIMGNILIGSLVISQQSTPSTILRRANERGILRIPKIPISIATPTPTIDFASLESTPTILGTPSQSTATLVDPASMARLYFQKYAENAVDPTCFAVHVRGVNASGWFVTVDGLGNRGNLDSAGNTNVCGLTASQEVTFTVYNGAGKVVQGGRGIPTRGGDLMAGYWQ